MASKLYNPGMISMGKRSGRWSANRVSIVCKEILRKLPNPAKREIKQQIIRDVCIKHKMNQYHIENIMF